MNKKYARRAPRRRKSKVPEWVREVRVNERKRTLTFKVDLMGLMREAKAGDRLATFVIRPHRLFGLRADDIDEHAFERCDYMVEFHLGNIVVPAPLSVFFPDENTRGDEFFHKAKQMLQEAGALRPKGQKRPPEDKPAPVPERRCGNCRHAIWPKDKRSEGKCMDPEQFKHDHCAEVWPDGRMKIKARWGAKCPPFEEKKR